MKKITLTLLIIFVAIINVLAQKPVQGRVYDADTKKPIENASVYFNNTEIGMKTNDIGAFRLYPKVLYKDLVVSAVGYEKFIISVENLKSSYVVYLKPKEDTLAEVKITIDRNGWKKWGEFFQRLLFGNYMYYTGSCKIINPKDIIFYYDKDDKTLEIALKRPLIVTNSDLGYIYNIDVDEFKYSFLTDAIRYRSTIQYEEIKNKGRKKMNVQAATNDAYYGSKAHFFRSLYSNSLEEEGFKLSKYWSVKNVEKERVVEIIQKRQAEKIASGSWNALHATLSDNIDSANYYRQILAQNDEICWGTKNIDLKDILTFYKGKGKVLLKFSDTLLLTYNRNNEVLNQFVSKKNPGHPYTDFSTKIFLTNSKGVEIDAAGFAYDNVLFMIGDLGNRRLAKELPLNYDPREGRKLYDVVSF